MRSRKLSKKVKLPTMDENSSIQANSKVFEIDEFEAAAKKALLNRDCSEWDLVCANWKHTFPLSQRESKEMDSVTFLQQ